VFEYIEAFQTRCNRLYRQCFVDESKRNESFITNKGFTLEFARSLILNVKTDIKMREECLKLIDNHIIELEKDFKNIQNELQTLYKQPKTKKLNKQIKRLKNKRDRRFKKIQKLKKSLTNEVVFGGRSNLQNRSMDLITHEMFHQLRTNPVWFRGDSAYYGNRSFDLKKLNNGLITFKNTDLNCDSSVKKLEFNIKISSKNRQKVLDKLQILINNKEIPLVCSITPTLFYLSYDETKLNGSFFDKKRIASEFKELKTENPVKFDNEIARKAYWNEIYTIRDNKLKQEKLDRFLSVDLNPSEIGYVISERDGLILESGCLHYIDTSKSSNKRTYEYGQMIKYLFNKIKHYRVSYFVIEDLKTLKTTGDHGNTNSNRKINNEFNLNLLEGLIERNCNETKTILRKIKPQFSSFIGNIMNYGDYDPIAAAKEISRRGISQFTTGSTLYPTITKDISTHWKIDEFDDTESYKKWFKLYKSFKTKKYRNKEFNIKTSLFNIKSDLYLYVSKDITSVGTTVTDLLIH
jgi:hypothetical protein